MVDEERLEELLSKDSFVRWIQGDALAEEVGSWEKWMKEGGYERKKLVEEAYDIIFVNESEAQNIPDPNAALSRLNRLIDGDERKTSVSSPNKKRKRSYAKVAGSVLSVLLVLVTGIYFYWDYGQINRNMSKYAQRSYHQTIQTHANEKKSITLDDGTSITVNANSQLSYSVGLDKKNNKKVDTWLKGEAYFDVPHYTGAKKRIFWVHTKDGIIEDLGTQFVVKTSSDETRAVLSKGKIKILVQNKAGKDLVSQEIEPSEKANFQSGHKNIGIEKVNTRIYTSWINGKFVFDNTSAQEVLNRIRDTFGLKIVVNNQKVLQNKFSGSIKSTNLKVLKKALSGILHVPVKQKKKTLYIGDPEN